MTNLPNMKPAQLLEAATSVLSTWPDAELVKNQVGNLSVHLRPPDCDCEIPCDFVGWVDLRYGEVHDLASEDIDDE